MTLATITTEEPADPTARRRRRRAVLLSAPLIALLGFTALLCCRSVDGLLDRGEPEPILQGAEGYDDVAQFRYLGCGGWSIRLGDQHLVTAPFWSNPGVLRVGLWTIAPDEELIAERLAETPLNDASAMLVGHGHHDHLLDIPVIAATAPEHGGLSEDCIIYGSRTVGHVLAAVGVPVHAVNDAAGDATTPGEWLPSADAPVRIMALRSDHAPHFLGMRFLQDGPLSEDRESLPNTAWFWTMGEPFAYVVDFLGDDGEPRFRLYYQDTATSAPHGMPPPMPDGKPFDAAILCLASYTQVDEHPEQIIARTQPRVVFAGHWEDFFADYSAEPDHVMFSDPKEFLERLAVVHEGPPDTRILPAPGALYFVPVEH